MRNVFIILIGCLFITASCNDTLNNTNNSGSDQPGNAAAAPAKANQGPVQSKLNEAGTQTLMNVVSKYYGLKNAFVATKAVKVDSAAALLAAAADSLHVSLQKDTVNNTALKPFVDTLQSQSKLISTIKDETCEKQRITFEIISRNMYALLKAADLKNVHIYHQYCPMAFNDKGAYWLSDNSEILNPYFGKKMLECGEVTDSF